MNNGRLNILYFGDDNLSTTSYHRACALRRLGNNVDIYNPTNASKKLYSLFNIFHFHTGYNLLQFKITKWLNSVISLDLKPDLIWVNSGEYFGPSCLKYLKKLNCPIILYNNDDPTGGRDGNRFKSLLKAIPFYDLCVVMRDVNVLEYNYKGAKSVLKVNMSYDEIVHQPFEFFSDIPDIFKSEVAFIGTWMRHEKRDEFLLELIKQGVPISIWGQRWQKSRIWSQLKPYYRGDNLIGRDYVAAIQGAKICIGFLSKGNRDLHTTRTMEIPYAGGFFCAERTSEHLQFYKEGVEAVFWGNAIECAEVCKKLLDDISLRERICISGMKRVRELNVGNEDICRNILSII